MRRTGVKGRYYPFIVFALLVFPLFPLRAFDFQKDVLQPAQRQIGSGYCRGGVTPPCFDCSGFISYLLTPHVPDLPRTSRGMATFGSRTGERVDRDDLVPGDLLFFATTPDPRTISHVALYIGQNSIIHAVSDGPNRGVNVTPLDARYWRTRFHSAVRILPHLLTGGTTTSGPIRFAKGVYTGELKNGEPHGQGTMQLDNGDVYKGEFRNGVFEGQGVYIWKDGRRFKGRFSDGAVTKDGVLIRAADGPEEKKDAETSATEPLTEDIPTTYLRQKDSPWESWDGYMMGDFYAWKQQEEEAFEEWKKHN